MKIEWPHAPRYVRAFSPAIALRSVAPNQERKRRRKVELEGLRIRRHKMDILEDIRTGELAYIDGTPVDPRDPRMVERRFNDGFRRRARPNDWGA